MARLRLPLGNRGRPVCAVRFLVAVFVLVPAFHLLRALVIVALLGLAATSSAEQEAIRLHYSAPTGCPTTREFQDLVFERTHGARPAGSDETAREFVVTVRKRGRKLEGTLAVREGDVTFARTVHGSNCVEIATVLALATALAIDPRAELDSGQDDETPSPQNWDDTGDTDQSTAAPGNVAPPAAETSAGNPRPVPDEGQRDEPYGRERAALTRRGLGVSLGPRMMVAATPRPAWGGVLAIDAQVGTQPLRWGVELSVLQTPDKWVQSARARFQFVLAAPELCVTAWQTNLGTAISPCVGAELGWLTGHGRDLPVQRTERRFWGSALAQLKLEQALGRVWFASLGGGLVVPFTRYRFEFEQPQTPIYLAPTVVGTASLRLGARF